MRDRGKSVFVLISLYLSILLIFTLNFIIKKYIITVLLYTVLFIIISMIILINVNKRFKRDLFIKTIIHDMKTPIYSIINLIEKEKGNFEEDNYKKIDISMKNLLNTFNSYLDIKNNIKINKNLNKCEKIYLDELKKEIYFIINPLASAKNINFNIYNNSVKNEKIIGDKDKILRVLINVLSNSVKYTRNNGSIILVVSEVMKNGRTCLQFEVRDSGIGMSKKFLKNIFDPYKRENKKYVEKNDGVGLGMYIINELVKSMKGKVLISSKERIGTTICITIPTIACSDIKYDFLKDKRILYYNNDVIDYHYQYNTLKMLCDNVDYCHDLLKFDKDEYDYIVSNCDNLDETISINNLIFKREIYYKILNSKKENPDMNLCGKRILIADDNEINLEITSEIVKEKGIIVETAKDGLALFKKFISSKINYYDIIMTDINMPILDGYDVCDKIRNLDREDAKKIPIIVVSGDSSQCDKQIFDSLNITDYLDKPININRLTNILFKCLNSYKS